MYTTRILVTNEPLIDDCSCVSLMHVVLMQQLLRPGLHTAATIVKHN